MSNKIILGVDGGNTKTDFLLFSDKGECLAKLRTGTCSHEALPGGFTEAAEKLKNGIEQVCAFSHIDMSDIDYAVFGLAGADTAEQHRILSEYMNALLPGRIVVCNDSILGIKAAVPNGTGICCINGTATSVSGVNAAGKYLQVGGIGSISSDFAGGSFAAGEVLRYIYSERYRDGKPTALTNEVLTLLGADETNNLMELFHLDNLDKKAVEYDLNRILFRCAENGDEAAQEILHTMAHTLAQSTSGCIKLLGFTDCVSVVLAGSLWIKAGYRKMQELYYREVEERTCCTVNLVLLEEPPALGAVLWALECLTGTVPMEEIRNKIRKSIGELE